MRKPSEYSSLRRFGDLKHSFRAADHDGWVILDGRTIRRASFPRFFEAVGSSAETLMLPVGKDCLIIGAGGRLKVWERGGSNEILLTVDQLPAHDHGYADSYEEPAVQTGGLLAGVLKLMTGLTAKTADKRTAKAGAGKPIPLAPLAIGANIFVYVGEPVG